MQGLHNFRNKNVVCQDYINLRKITKLAKMTKKWEIAWNLHNFENDMKIVPQYKKLRKGITMCIILEKIRN